MKRHGYPDTRALDLNLNYYDYVWDNHDAIIAQLSDRLSKSSKRKDRLYGFRKKILERASNPSRRVRAARDYFRRNFIRGEDPAVSSGHMSILNSSLDAYAALYIFGNTCCEDFYSSEQVMRDVGDEAFPYADFYEHEFRKIKRGSSPDFIGISLVFEHQLVHAFAAARWAKLYFPKAFVCLGGTAITKVLRSPLCSERTRGNIFRYVDGVVLYEAEHSLPELLQYIQRKRRTFTDKVNILLPDKSVLSEKPGDQKDLFSPDYSDMPYERYFNMNFLGDRIKLVPFLASRGCYWRKCRFCVSHLIYRGFRSCEDYGALVQEIARWRRKFGFRLIRFNDEALLLENIRRLSRAIIDKGLRIKWLTNMRVDPRLDEQTCRLLYRSGCRKLLLGVESGSQRVVDSMRKGIFVRDAEAILPMLSKAGIAPHLYIMSLYPGERLSDLRKTHDFLVRNRRYIDSFSMTVFDGELLAPIFSEMDRSSYELPDPEHDFYASFFVKRRPTRKQEELVKRIHRMRMAKIKSSYRHN